MAEFPDNFDELDQHTQYMWYFFEMYERMVRQGPGSAETTIKSFQKVPNVEEVKDILEVGCGKGISCFTLSGVTGAHFTAVDNYKPFTDFINEKAKDLRLEDRIKGIPVSMMEMKFPEKSFDVILSEGSAYFMGFENALNEWKRFLRPGGSLIISDAVWTCEMPSDASMEHWGNEYPDMTTLEFRCKQAQKSGYTVVDSFLIPDSDLIDYYDDLDCQIAVCKEKYGNQQAFWDSQAETSYGRKHLDEFGYGCLVLQTVTT